MTLRATKEKRLRYIQKYYELNKKEAAERLKSADESRRNYVRDVFGQDVRDILAYDCVINTTWLPHDEVAEIITARLSR